MTTKLRLTLDIEYELNGETINQLKSKLYDIIDRASGEGWFTGYTDAEVVTWKSKVVDADDENQDR